MSEATAQDWQIIDRAERKYRQQFGPAHGLLTAMAGIADDDPVRVPINLYSHCLQTATRVLRAGADEELVVVALFHDLPEAFSDNHHGLLAAQLLAPWISERRSWLLRHHVEFQNYHFANHPTRDRNERDRYRGHPYFAETAEFCERYDQNSFDPRLSDAAIERIRAHRQEILQRTRTGSDSVAGLTQDNAVLQANGIILTPWFGRSTLNVSPPQALQIPGKPQEWHARVASRRVKVASRDEDFVSGVRRRWLCSFMMAAPYTISNGDAASH